MNPAGCKILLVDDDRLIREIYGRQLQAAGYAVLPAGGAAEAFEMAQREKPAVVILDVNLPDGNGLATLQQLQEHESTCDIAVIMITSNAEYRTYREFAKAGNAVAFLTKPFGPKQLLAEVQKALQPSASGDGC